MKRITSLKTLITVLGFILFSAQLTAQNTFRINYDIANFDLASGVAETPAGNYLFSGTNATFLPLFGNLFEVDQVGNVVWANSYVAGIATEFSDVKNISSGGYIVSGATSPGLMLMNVANGGGVNWANRYETNNGTSEGGARVIETSDGGFLTAGRVYGYDPAGPPTILDSANLYIIKTNSAGTIVWDKIVFVTTAFDNDHTINDMTEVVDGYIFVGTLSDSNLDPDNGGSSSGVIFKTDFNGNMQWINRLGAIGTSQSANSAYTLSNGEVLVSGVYDADLMLLRVNAAGTITWSYQYGAGGGLFPNTAEGFDAFETNDGKYAVLGTFIDFSAFPAFSIGSFLLKAEPANANPIFERGYLGGLSTILPEGIQVSDSGYVLGMMAQQITGFNYHLIKTDPNGDLLDPTCTPTAISFANSSFSPSFIAIAPNEYSGSTRTGFTPIVSNLTPTQIIDCQTIICTPPANPTASATSSPICAGSSTTINGAGSGAGVVYDVYTTATGGTSIGTTPLVVSPGVTTTYYVEAVVTATSCSSVIRDPITITVVNITTSNAGANQSVCATSTNLAGNTSTNGSGAWTLISGAGAITTPSSPTSGVTSLGIGPNVFEWTISNAPCTPSTSQVTITGVATPTVSAAGSNQTLCATSATLAGNTPTIGTGTWTLISGSGTITTPGAPNSGVTGLGTGPNVFEWTISNNPCTPSTSQVTITGVAAPTISNAGTNQSVCATSATLAGNTATVGSGAWTLISGTGTITSPTSPTSGVTGLGTGPNVFEWTISNTPCTPSTSQVTITGVATPTVSNAGSNQTICATSTNLAGNTATVGSGTWTLISGAGTITTPGSPNSGVTGLGTGPNVFEWTITNSPCPPSTSQVTITNTGGPTTSAAGSNQTLCATSATLAANTPTTGTGAWTLISGTGTITSPTSPNSGVTGLGTGPNVFEWTISNAPCAPSTSQVTITGVATPTVSNAGSNQTICATSTNLAGNTATVGSGTWTLISGAGTITTPGSPTSGVTGLGVGPNVFEWTITNSPCAPSTSQVTITNTGGPTTSVAGTNQTVCSTSATLTGNTPTTGTGAWTLISGAGTITSPTSPNSGVTGLGTGPNVFEWTISNAPCAPSTSQVTITGVAAPTTSVAGANQTVCANTATLNGNTPTIGTGTWTLISGSGTVTTPGSPTSGVTGLGTGANVFEWTISNAPCTSSSTQVTITYSLGPTVIANSTDTLICQGDIITLTGAGAVSYTWTGGANDGVPFSPGTTTTYIVTGTDANSCSNTDTILVTVNPLPTIIVTGANTICNGDSTLLTATGGASYVWNTSDITPTINVIPSVTTTYNVIGTDANGCQNTGQITVTVLAPPIATISGASTVCDGDVVNLTASGGGTYSWSTGDTTTIINVNPTGTTTYTLIATIGSCIDTTTFTVNVTPLPTVILTPSPDTTISLGESADLIASGGTSYTWTPSTDLSCSTCANPTATPQITTVYCVEVTNNGCVDTACVTVIVDVNCGEVFVPTAFSPNNDGANDCLKVYNNCIETMLFRVYARWGEVVFEATDVDQCWDGSFKGKNLNNAVFVYTLEATLITGEEVSLKGNVSLIR